MVLRKFFASWVVVAMLDEFVVNLQFYMFSYSSGALLCILYPLITLRVLLKTYIDRVSRRIASDCFRCFFLLRLRF
jgi:hypothetical protein